MILVQFLRKNEEINEDQIRQCFNEIIFSELDKFQQLYDTLSENQSLLLRAIAKEKYVNAINASGFIKKYNLKTARASTRHSNI